MADTPAKTGAPARKRPAAATKAAPAAKTATAKAAQKPAAATRTTRATTKAKAAPEPVVEETTPPKDAEGREKVLVEFEFVNQTKTYNVFKPITEGFVGSLYCPHGSDEVRGLVFMVDEE